MKYLTTISMAIAAIIPLASFAQDNTTAPEALAFTISGINNGNWVVTGEPIYGNSNIQTELITTYIFGNSYWKAECFGITGTNWNELRCGAYMPTTPTIYNLSPIPNKISKVICNLTLKSGGDKNKISCIRLKVSPSENMDDAIVQQIENPSLNSTPRSFEFSIADPKDNMFYRIELECPTISFNVSEGGLAFNSLSFYRQLSPTPLINKIYNADNKIDHIEVLSEIGDLHLLVNEYDLDGNHIREVIGPNVPTQNSPAKAAPEYPADWTNQVAEANTAYIVNLPTDPNRMILIRAKSVNDGIHSTETSTIFTDAGIETGISPISTESYDNTPIYYNLQGIRVERPSAPGLYLRVQNGKTTKIHIP